MSIRSRELMVVSLLVLGLAACGDGGQPDLDPTSADENTGSAETPELTLSGDAKEIDARQVHHERMMPVELQEWDAPVVQIARSEDEFAGAWASYNLDGEMPEIDWDDRVAIFHGLRESGTCPYEVIGLSIDGDVLTGHLDLDVDGSLTCTDDDNPVTIVTVVEREAIDERDLRIRYLNEPAERYYRDTESDPVDVTNALALSGGAYPFTVWRSPGEPRDTEARRAIEWAEITAVDESTVSIAFGFLGDDMVPDTEHEDGYQVTLDPIGEEGDAPTRVGLSIEDAGLTFAPPGVAPINLVGADEPPVPGVNYHPLMSDIELWNLHRSRDGDDGTSIELILDVPGDDLSWQVRRVPDEAAIEMTVTADE